MDHGNACVFNARNYKHDNHRLAVINFLHGSTKRKDLNDRDFAGNLQIVYMAFATSTDCLPVTVRTSCMDQGNDIYLLNMFGMISAWSASW